MRDGAVGDRELAGRVVALQQRLGPVARGRDEAQPRGGGDGAGPGPD